MKLMYVFLFFLSLSCVNRQVDENKSLCESCPEDNSGQYQLKKLSKFIRNDSKGMLKVNSTFKENFIECSDTKISDGFDWFYLSKDKSRNHYHLISQGDYSTELWVIAFNKNNNIIFCFLGAASGGDGGDGFEISSDLKDNILRQVRTYTSIFMDSLTNDFTDSLKTENIYVEYLVRDNKLTLLKTDTVSNISTWGKR